MEKETKIIPVDSISSTEIIQTLPIITKATREPPMLTVFDVQLDFAQLPENINPNTNLNSEDLQLLQNAIYQFAQPGDQAYPVVTTKNRVGLFIHGSNSSIQAKKLYDFIAAIKEGDEEKMRNLINNRPLDDKHFPNPIGDSKTLRRLKNKLKTTSSFPDSLRIACIPSDLSHQEFVVILALLYTLYAQVERELEQPAKKEEYKRDLKDIIQKNLNVLSEQEITVSLS